MKKLRNSATVVAQKRNSKYVKNNVIVIKKYDILYTERNKV